MNFRIGNYTVHNKEQWELGEKPLLCIHKYTDNRNVSQRVFCLSREWLRLLKNPLGYCGYCQRYFAYPKRRHRNTCYCREENELNFMYACKDCQDEDDAYYQELWDDYCRSRF